MLNPISILSSYDVCECCIVLYRDLFCRWPSDVNYFWCERARERRRIYHIVYSGCNERIHDLRVRLEHLIKRRGYSVNLNVNTW